jgi:hypothetical protein
MRVLQFGSIWARIRASEHANDLRVFIKGREFPGFLGDYQLSRRSMLYGLSQSAEHMIWL